MGTNHEKRENKLVTNFKFNYISSQNTKKQKLKKQKKKSKHSKYVIEVINERKKKRK